MSIMRSTGVRSTFASFIEVALFFCVLSVAFFVVCFGVYHVIAQPLAKLGHAEELTQAIDMTRSSAKNMVDARREMIDKARLAAEALAAYEEAPAGAAAGDEPAAEQPDMPEEAMAAYEGALAGAAAGDEPAAEQPRLTEEQSASAASDAKRAKRFAEQTAENAQDEIANAARLMVADSSEAAGGLADSAGQVAASVKAMNEAIGEAVKMTTAPEEQPEEESADQADEETQAAADDEQADEAPEETDEQPTDEPADAADEQAEDEPPKPTPPPVHLGESVVRLVADIDTLRGLAYTYEKVTGKARKDIQEITDGGEKAAGDAVRVAAAGIFPDDIAAIAAATTAKALDVALGGLSDDDSAAVSQAVRAAIDEATAPDGPDIVETVRQAVVAVLNDVARVKEDKALAVSEDAAVIADATVKAVRTSLDEVGRVPDRRVAGIIETVADAVRTALDDVEGLGEDDVLSIVEVARRALGQALAAADLAATPPGEKGQMPPWADELVERFAADRLKAAEELTGSLPATIEAISAVESAATDVLSATRAARADIQATIRAAQAGREPDAPAPWWHEADAFIDLAERIEANARKFVADAEAIAARADTVAQATEQERAALAAEIESVSTNMIDRAKAVVDASPVEVWAGKEDLTDLVEQIDSALEDVIADAQVLAGTAAEAADDATDEAPVDESASAPAEQDTGEQLVPLAERLHRGAREILAQCQAACAAIRERRTTQAKTLLDLAWRIEDLAKQVRRRARSALAAADAAGREQVSPGQSTGESIAQGLGEVRIGRVFQAKFPLISFSRLFGSLPWWMWVIEGLVYLFILTVYWAPGEDAAMDACELRAFALFAGVVVVSALVAMELQGQYLSRAIRLFFDILQRSG